ncbi:hypothetical protein A3H38_03010 [candidate division WOR-1 bacterium RIFCSPLOWO2_02_FULL_46_20]|uniref:Methyltransferase type 12 domain-containing protein n=2 Tax=Saganbacteria TaxID=1703751 RepID=A0A1F4RAR4_UNCSA|nr:MAG: hypothetical protein A3J44_00765 [candidate division WOR-1 bacterium RIFCSPHIGHO2_02_FULL_45_12]OGC04613.1 MAG: hypothetical protein A3H38_03010 [candidate division WOR-1 bacterium RIFCSPLOWO2_02_FULL_46_20]OGC08862.1 MAG: hypothetical protein A3F86_00250 [candidate division WOR-1 bacterium RIFCSPLOWO2_12_FULL_45_9]
MAGKQKQIEYFENLLAKHGENYLALDWNNTEGQKLRFQILAEILVFGKKSVKVSLLDVGCGFGDLYALFKEKGMLASHRINYTGFDISPGILEVAKKKHPEAKFELKDILEEPKCPKFDYIFCSGVFNIRTADKETHLAFVKSMLVRMFELAHCGVAVNFLSEGILPICNREDLNSGRYFIFNPTEILDFCRSICGRYMLRHDYHLGDFSVYLLK